jgi:hypothetical protein
VPESGVSGFGSSSKCSLSQNDDTVQQAGKNEQAWTRAKTQNSKGNLRISHAIAVLRSRNISFGSGSDFFTFLKSRYKT